MSKSKPHIPCCTEVSLPYHGQNTDSTRENGDFSFVIPKKRKGTGLKKKRFMPFNACFNVVY